MPIKTRVLMMSTSFPIKKNMVSGIFVGRLCDALQEYMDVLVVAPDSADSMPVAPKVVVFRYALKKYQTLAHTPGGIPARLKKNRLLFLYVPIFLVSYLLVAIKKARTNNIIVANWAISGLVGVVVKRVTHIPLITILRGEDVKFSKTKNRVLDIAVKYSDRVVVVSEEMKQALNDVYPAHINKIFLISNGVEKFENPVKHQNTVVKLIFVGSLIARKNVEFILRDLAQLTDIDFTFDVLGDGDQLSQLKCLVAALQLEKSVVFHGYKDPCQIYGLISQADYYVSASLHEGRPNSVVEAMAAGCLPILSDISGHRELVENISDELLFSTGVSGSLATAIRKVVELSQLSNDLHTKVKKSVQDNFNSWGECAGQYAQLIDSVLEGR